MKLIEMVWVCLNCGHEFSENDHTLILDIDKVGNVKLLCPDCSGTVNLVEKDE